MASITRAGFLIVVAVLAACLIGCGPAPVTRKNLQACDYGRLRCAENAREETPYSLNYIDVDANGKFEDRSQLDQAERYVTEARTNYANTLVVVFVHGWFHSDDPTDRDVNRARQMLWWFAKYHPGWHVEGVYVGWPAWTNWPTPFQYLTFWSRKDRADALGHGALSEIVSRMDGAGRGAGNMKLLFIGHSFGGRALYLATEQTFRDRLKDAVDAWRNINPNPTPEEANKSQNIQHPVRGVGSLVVMLEPALTADEFVKLYNASNQAFIDTMKPPTAFRAGIFAKNDRPLLISITGDADSAVKVALPMSRMFSKSASGTTQLVPWTVDRQPYDLKNEDLQSEAFGRFSQMVTHRIEANGSVSESCKNTGSVDYGGVDGAPFPGVPLYQLPKGWLQCAVRQQVILHPDIKSGAGFDQLVVPDSCLQLRHLSKTSAFNPYWNASAHLDVIQGHSEFMNQTVIEFINQMLFSDSYENTISADQCQWVQNKKAPSESQPMIAPVSRP